MKTILALVALAATATCQSSSAPFELVLESSNSTLNGTVLGACHEGAATEGLCATSITPGDPFPYTTFTYVITNDDESDIDNDGLLHYELLAQNSTIPSNMVLSYSPHTNVAVPIISPGDSGIYVSFDECGYLYIKQTWDDSVNPQTFIDPPAKLENWYVCTTYWSYTYNTLVWKVGKGEVQNSQCSAVRVKRVFF